MDELKKAIERMNSDYRLRQKLSSSGIYGRPFIGSHLTTKLFALGYRPVIVDNLSVGSTARLSNLMHQKRVQFVRADVRDYEAMKKLVARTHVIIHLAALISVKKSIGDPLHEDSIRNARDLLRRPH